MKYNSLIKHKLLQSYILYTNSTQQLKLSSLNNKTSFAEHSPSSFLAAPSPTVFYVTR